MTDIIRKTCGTLRSNLANQLKMNINRDKDGYNEKIERSAEPILDHFESLGFMLKENIAPEEYFWILNSYEVLRYWSTLSEYIHWVRKVDNDPTYFEEFEYLHDRMAKLEMKKHNRRKGTFTPEELNDFLTEETLVKDFTY